MDMEASWNDSMGAKTVYDQLRPSGIEDRMVGKMATAPTGPRKHMHRLLHARIIKPVGTAPL
ncbi:hypothetical protein LXL04_033954 [Taraxacum kok-saghyz]